MLFCPDQHSFKREVELGWQALSVRLSSGDRILFATSSCFSVIREQLPARIALRPDGAIDWAARPGCKPKFWPNPRARPDPPVTNFRFLAAAAKTRRSSFEVASVMATEGAWLARASKA